jgi:DNA polymerase-4
MTRKIIHFDLDAFFCAVEEKLNPTLKGVSFAVGGKPQDRGVVASCSYPARKFGIRSAMPMARAIKLCPELVIVPSNHHEYAKVSHDIFDRLRQITNEIEQVSIDEAYFDVTENPNSAESIAKEIQTIIKHKFGLPSSLGVAGNKLVAKIANDVGKSAHHSDSPPNAITIVNHGDESQFLVQLPAETLWGVGPKTAAKLEEMGIYTIGDIARWSQDDLIKRFGKHGILISKFSRGIDERPLVKLHTRKSISRETTFSTDSRDREQIRKTLESLSENVVLRLSKANQAGSTVKIKVRWSDFTTITRQSTLKTPTNTYEIINKTALKLLDELWDNTSAIRLIGVGISNLSSPDRQLNFLDMDTRSKELEEALTELKSKYGDGIVTRGRELAGNEQ